MSDKKQDTENNTLVYKKNNHLLGAYLTSQMIA